MKVEGPLAGKPAGIKRRGGVSAGSADSFADALGVEAPAAPSSPGLPEGVGGTTAPPSVSALLALQGAMGPEGEGAAAARAKTRAEDLLRKLDQLRLDLLTGAIPRHHLIGLAQTAKSMRHQVFDPRLNDILDEIDLRAQVELAKYDPYR